MRRFALLLAAAACACAAPVARPASQNPSPMVEHTRAHARISSADSARGERFEIRDLLPAPVRVFVPASTSRTSATLLIHFHGAAFIAEHAAWASERGYIVASIHLGAGSRAYERPFMDPALLGRVIDTVRQTVGLDTIDAVVLSGFSAGYGAIRAILRDSSGVHRIEGVLLLDGLHTGYVPEGQVIDQGGRLDTTLLDPFVRFAQLARAGRKRVVVTHSEIFPGTFASTTETTDHIIESLGLKRTPVLEWGPVGMQQVSSVRAGSLAILGFAGNTAPDHVDHFHGLPAFLELYDRLPAVGAP